MKIGKPFRDLTNLTKGCFGTPRRSQLIIHSPCDSVEHVDVVRATIHVVLEITVVAPWGHDMKGAVDDGVPPDGVYPRVIKYFPIFNLTI